MTIFCPSQSTGLNVRNPNCPPVRNSPWANTFKNFTIAQNKSPQCQKDQAHCPGLSMKYDYSILVI